MPPGCGGQRRFGLGVVVPFEGNALPLRNIRKGRKLRVLNPADLEQWTAQGYVVVKNAAP